MGHPQKREELVELCRLETERANDVTKQLEDNAKQMKVEHGLF